MDRAMAMEVAAMSRQRAADDAAARGDSDVQRWYSGSTALLTGGSGFLGKQLAEKLLRTCDMRKIYLILRARKGRTPKERLIDVLTDPVFDKLRQQQPDFQDKVTVLEGDVSELRLGLSDQDWEKAAEEVNVIFHVAATTRFNDPLRHATLTNVRGTREALRLGKACKNLKSFVYVSTAFSHATESKRHERVLEQFYASPVPPDLMIEMAETLDEATLNSITPQLLQGQWINTYTLTKVVAEEAVKQIGSELPICIVRPTIVISSYQEPIPGWLDQSCVFGPTGLFTSVGVGLFHTAPTRNENRIDLVPVDYVNNATIAAAWQTARVDYAEPRIYTVTATRNPITWGEIHNFLADNVRETLQTPKVLWYPCLQEAGNLYIFWVLYWLFHYIPAYLIDAVCFFTGKKLRAVHQYTKGYKMFVTLAPFLLNHWDFDDSHLQSLYQTLSPTDREIFNFDINSVNNKEFIFTWWLGIRKFIIKDGLKGTEDAIKKQYWLHKIHYAVLPMYAYLLWTVLKFALSTIFAIGSFLITTVVCYA